MRWNRVEGGLPLRREGINYYVVLAASHDLTLVSWLRVVRDATIKKIKSSKGSAGWRREEKGQSASRFGLDPFA
jgi:hypothetical protein